MLTRNNDYSCSANVLTTWKDGASGLATSNGGAVVGLTIWYDGAVPGFTTCNNGTAGSLTIASMVQGGLGDLERRHNGWLHDPGPGRNSAYDVLTTCSDGTAVEVTTSNGSEAGLTTSNDGIVA